MHGTVVDADGKPVAGARVAAGAIIGDAAGIAVPPFAIGAALPELRDTR